MLRRKGIVIVPACESVCFFSSEILRCWGDVHTYFAFPRESFPFFPVAYLKKQRKQTIIFPDGKKKICFELLNVEAGFSLMLSECVNFLIAP